MHLRTWMTMGVLAGLLGCAVPARSTQVRGIDLQDMSAAMAQSLAASPVIAARDAQSTPWVVSMQRVTNLTQDVLTPSEMWYAVQRVRSGQSMVALAQQRNIRFVIPAERVREMRNDRDIGGDIGDFDETFGESRNVTHVLTATFRSVTRVNSLGTDRSDLYYTEFEILELASGVPVWTDRFEFKRRAKGKVWD